MITFIVLRDSPNTADIVVDDLLKTIVILEVGCCVTCICTCVSPIFFVEYQPLIHALTVGGYSTKLVVLIYGSLGHVRRLCARGLQIAGLNKKNSANSQILLCVSNPWQ